MTQDTIVFLGRDAMMVTLLASAPMLLSGMVIGLVISVLQSVTQIQEITLTFVPKIIVVMIAFVLFLPFMMNVVLEFVRPIFGEFHTVIN
jgi:flagellar biosynthetic protein FliQ